jgi:type IV pilus assembly protein PilC
VLEDFFKESRRADELRRQWWLAVAYPLVILSVAGVVLTLLSILVVPVFVPIFREFNLRLPLLTEVSVTVASWLARLWPLLLIGFVLLFGGLIFVSIRWPLRTTGIVGRLPALFGGATTLARFSQFLADLLEAGLSVPDSLRVAGFLTSRRKLQTAAWRLADQLEFDAGAAQHIQPPPATVTVFHALRSEIPTASRIRLLREISLAHADRARLRLSWVRGFIEPVTILAVAMVVGTLVVAMFLPLIKLIQGLTG